jgi:hypothetical protein
MADMPWRITLFYRVGDGALASLGNSFVSENTQAITRTLERVQDVYSLALADGVVTDVHISGASIGNGVDVLHAGNILTRQYHFKTGSVLVRAGGKVQKGDRLGVLGTTGRSTGIHLHFGLKLNSTKWNNGTYADPEPYLRGEKTIGSAAPPTVPTPPTGGAIEFGDKVRVLNAVQYGATPIFKAWSEVYEVMQVSGGRAVIGIGGIVTAAVNVKNLMKI